ncbi:hypothetical protein BDV18DRAFT_44069 [Aspergillus unguis]
MSNTQSIYDGITGTLRDDEGGSSDGLLAILTIFIALSCYNTLELVLLILSTFRRWKGLYFWSLLTSGLFGVVPYSIGFLLKFFSNADPIYSVSILTVGWWTMVTGQAFVLYSRLHLVLRDERILQRILYMIIANVFLLHVPTTIFTYGSNVIGEPSWVKGYDIMEKIQMSGFTVQEVIISALYVWETIRMLQLTSSRENRKIMHQLVGINVAIVVMDLVLLGLEYASIYAIQITLKGVIYSVKLKLEFAVLGKLVDVVHNNQRTNVLEPPDNLYFLQPSRPLNGVSAAAHGGVSHDRSSVMNSVSGAARSDIDIAVPGDKILAMTEVSTWVERRQQSSDF